MKPERGGSGAMRSSELILSFLLSTRLFAIIHLAQACSQSRDPVADAVGGFLHPLRLGAQLRHLREPPFLVAEDGDL